MACAQKESLKHGYWFEFSKLCAKILKGFNLHWYIVEIQILIKLLYKNDAIEAVSSIFHCFCSFHCINRWLKTNSVTTRKKNILLIKLTFGVSYLGFRHRWCWSNEKNNYRKKFRVRPFKSALRGKKVHSSQWISVSRFFTLNQVWLTY